MKHFWLLAPLFLAVQPAIARPVVLELFTSQSCSSCPPADALLASLAATRPDVLALDFHVDYWNYLSWHDRFSSAAATRRQRRYAAALGTEVYTPQLVVDGQWQAVGSDRTAVLTAIASAQAATAAGPSLVVATAGGTLAIDVGNAAGAGDVVLVGFDSQHVTQVGAGENAGRVLREVNVVRSLTSVGTWQGTVRHFDVPRPTGDQMAVLVQDAEGKILAAAGI